MGQPQLDFVLKIIYPLPHIGGHLVIHLVAGVGDPVVDPERGRCRIVQQVSVALPEAVGNAVYIGVNRCQIRSCSIVCPEPENAANHVGQIGTGLSYHPEAGLLGGNGPLVQVAFPAAGEPHGAPTVGKAVSAGSDILCHIHGRSFEMVAHGVGQILHAHLVVGLHKEGNPVFQVIAQGVIHIGVGIFRQDATAFLGIGEPAVAQEVIGAPDAGVAGTGGFKIPRGIGFGKVEVLVFPLEIAFLAGKGNDVLGIEAVLRVVQREFPDAGLVGMSADVAVRNAAGHPYDTLVHVDAVADVHAFPNQIHDPGFVLVRDGESLPLGGIAVFVGQVHDDLNGLAGGFGPLQGDIDEGTVVDDASAVQQFLAAAVGGFRDDELVLVHVAHRFEGVLRLGDFAQIPARIPIVNLQHGPGGVIGRRPEIEFTIQRMGVGSIGNQARSVFAGTAGNDDVGAGVGTPFRYKNKRQDREDTTG